MNNVYCYDAVTDLDCRDVGINEGDVFYRANQTCGQNGFSLNCEGNSKRFKECPS